MAGSFEPPSDGAKGDDLSDLMQRFMASVAEFSQRLPFSVDLQKSCSITTLAALAITIVFAWKFFRTPPDQQRRQLIRPSSSSNLNNNAQLDTSLRSSEICSSSGNSRAQCVVNNLFQPGELSLEQLVRHKLSEGRKVTCQLLGIILVETTPEELQKHATVRSSVLEILLQIIKFCDVYLMERVLDDESGERVLSALDDSGIFTAGGLVKDKVLFCSTENGRVSFVRQLEPDWHIDTSPEIIHQLTLLIFKELSRPKYCIGSNLGYLCFDNFPPSEVEFITKILTRGERDAINGKIKGNPASNLRRTLHSVLSLLRMPDL